MEKMYNLPSWLCWAIWFALFAGELPQNSVTQTYIGLMMFPLAWYTYTNIKLKKMEGRNDGTAKQ
jgi:hypothetical protein